MSSEIQTSQSTIELFTSKDGHDWKAERNARKISTARLHSVASSSWSLPHFSNAKSFKRSLYGTFQNLLKTKNWWKYFFSAQKSDNDEE